MQIRKQNQLILGATALGALTATTVTAHAEETNSRVEKNQESSSVTLNEPNITENNTQQPVDERSTLGTQETAPTKRTEEIPFKTITQPCQKVNEKSSKKVKKDCVSSQQHQVHQQPQPVNQLMLLSLMTYQAPHQAVNQNWITWKRSLNKVLMIHVI